MAGEGWMRRLLSIMSGTAGPEKKSDIKMHGIGHWMGVHGCVSGREHCEV
jgi:hypothetical protein